MGIILVDMDGVISGFHERFVELWNNSHPEHRLVFDELTSPDVKDDVPSHLHDDARKIYRSPGFYLSLPTITGGLEALTEMSEDHAVFLCTSPIKSYRNCVLEKYLWVENNLGKKWVERIIMTYDKTVVRGDFLIEDNPEVNGAQTPEWELILFDRPYNRDVAGIKRLVDWNSWRKVLRL